LIAKKGDRKGDTEASIEAMPESKREGDQKVDTEASIEAMPE